MRRHDRKHDDHHPVIDYYHRHHHADHYDPDHHDSVDDDYDHDDSVHHDHHVNDHDGQHYSADHDDADDYDDYHDYHVVHNDGVDHALVDHVDHAHHGHDHEHHGDDHPLHHVVHQRVVVEFHRLDLQHHRPPLTTPMKISVAIAALNEGPQLAATVADCLACENPPAEIVIVDDNSLHRQNLPPWPGVRLYREPVRLGSGPAKHKAASLCTGDLVIVLDGHMRLPVDFFTIIADESRRSPLSILSPLNHGMESRSTHNGMGGLLVLADHGFYEVRWAPPRIDAHHSYPVPAVIGGCYCIPRPVLEAVGGYCPGYLGYGCEEEYLSLRAWVCGFDCRVVPRTETRHYYNRTLDRRSADGTGGERNWEVPFNRRVAAQVCFEDGVYERVYLPRMNKSFRNDDMDRELAARATEIASVRRHVQSNRRVKDADLAKWCGVSHP